MLGKYAVKIFYKKNENDAKANNQHNRDSEKDFQKRFELELNYFNRIRDNGLKNLGRLG